MKQYLQFTLITLGVILLQVMIINHIEISGLINPFVYIYPLLLIPNKTNRIAVLFVGFVIGLVLDAFSNTWGMHMAATTLTAFVRPYIFNLCASQEDKDKPSISYSIMPSTFVIYSSILITIHHLVLFGLEAFTFNHFWFTLLKAVVSSAMAIALTLIFEVIHSSYTKSQKKR